MKSLACEIETSFGDYFWTGSKGYCQGIVGYNSCRSDEISITRDTMRHKIQADSHGSNPQAKHSQGCVDLREAFTEVYFPIHKKITMPT